MARRTICILLSVVLVAFFASCQPAAATWIYYDTVVDVSAHGSYAIHCTLTGGDTLAIVIQVEYGKNITLYILDQTNYNNYASSRNFSYYDCLQNYVNATVTWQVPSTAVYYFVLDNKDSYTSTLVFLMITGEVGPPLEPLEIEMLDPSWLTRFVGWWGVAFLVIGGVLLAIRKENARWRV